MQRIELGAAEAALVHVQTDIDTFYVLAAGDLDPRDAAEQGPPAASRATRRRSPAASRC